jgi:hypothetical protein
LIHLAAEGSLFRAYSHGGGVIALATAAEALIGIAVVDAKQAAD